MSPLRARAPGKLILIGEHSAVFGRPALIAALGLHFDVQLKPKNTPGVRLGAVDNHPQNRSWTELLAGADRARDAWRNDRVRSSADPVSLIEIALGEARRHLDAEPAGLTITVRSEIPIGAGFGSSAALACAVPAAVIAWQNETWEAEKLRSIAMDIERRQHGRPSGIDHGTILMGGFVEASITEAGVRELTPVPVLQERLIGLRVFDTGTPRQTTGEMVARVRHSYDRNPIDSENRLDRMSEAVVQARNSLSGAEPASVLVEAIRNFHRELLAFGAVPPALAPIIEEIEQAGGAAKISGAGAADGEQAGALLVYHERPEVIASLPIPNRFRSIDAALGGPGLTVDKAG